jgi:D-arabinose 1-dehydrogenase-like Zn-dependent alcohol dehydrogenase
MVSYQIIDWGQPLQAREYPTPAPTGTQVLLKVDACGVCHSDLHIRDGFFDMGRGQQRRLADQGVELPLTLGHEPVGTVAAAGPDAAGVVGGDKRVVWPWVGCQECAACLRHEDILCERGRYLGARVDGGFSDYMLVPHPRYLLPYAGVDAGLAATYACAGITGYAALKRATANLGSGDILLLIGAGGVGLSALRIAPSMTDATIFVAEKDPAKRALAEQNGATRTLDNTLPGAAQKLRQETGGVAASVDFVGMEATSIFGIETLRRGGTHVIVGLFGGALTLPVPSYIYGLLTIHGSHLGTPAELQELLDLRRAGGIEPPPISTRPLAEAEAALQDLQAGRVEGRVILQP